MAIPRLEASTLEADQPLAPTRQFALDDLSRLYHAHRSFVRRAVIRLSGPDADVDDVVQEVFLVALERGQAFEGRSEITTWLYGIASRIVSSRRRRARVRRWFRLDAAADPVARDTPATLFEHHEASRTVYRILDKLTEKRRTVFIFYELEGMSGEQIAAALRCPLKTVWTRLHHARKDFQRRVEALEQGRP